jgi:hypothetical protein
LSARPEAPGKACIVPDLSPHAMSDPLTVNRANAHTTAWERMGPPHWRRQSRSPDELAGRLAEQEHEHQLFALILEKARREKVPIADLFLEASRFTNPGFSEQALLEALARHGRCLEENCAWEMDAQQNPDGNPSWITLTLPERGDLDSVLRRENNGQGETQDKEEHRGLFGLVIRLTQRLTGQRSTPRAARTRPADLPAKARPLWGFVRMLLLGAALALVYHFLVRRGLAPKFF